MTNNVIRQSHYQGMFFWVRDGNGALHATITGNTVSNTGFSGVLAQAGSGTGDTSFLCFDFGGAGALANTVVGGSSGLSVSENGDSTVRLPGYGGSPTDLAAISAYFQGRNTAPLSVSPSFLPPSGFTGGAACLGP